MGQIDHFCNRRQLRRPGDKTASEVTQGAGDAGAPQPGVERDEAEGQRDHGEQPQCAELREDLGRGCPVEQGRAHGVDGVGNRQDLGDLLEHRRQHVARKG